MRRSEIVAVGVVALAGGCSPSDAPAGRLIERVDSAGVEIVTNASPDRPLDGSMTEVLRLGGVDEGPEAFFQVGRDGLAADDLGRLFVLDAGRSQVSMFGPDGEHLRTMGAEGEGPGEMKRPSSLTVLPGGEALVLVGSKHAIVRFDPDGALPPALPLPDIRLPMANVGVASAEQLVLEDVTPTSLDATGVVLTATHAFLSVQASDGGGGPGDPWGGPVELASIDASADPWQPVSAPGCPMEIATPRVFTLQPVWTIAPDRLLYSGTHDYRIEVVDLETGGRMSVRRDLPVLEATKARAAADLGPFHLPSISPNCQLSATEHAERVGWEEEIPWIVDLSVAPDGRIYVLRRAPDETPSRRIDVFTPDGSYEGTLPPDIPFPAAWRSANEIIQREHDELHRVEVAVYRIGPR